MGEYKEFEWLVSRFRFIRIKEIEKEIKCPVNSLQKYFKGDRVLTEKWKSELRLFENRMKADCLYDSVPVEDIKVDNMVFKSVKKKGKLKVIKTVAPDSLERTEEKPSLQQNTSVISEDGKTVINSLPEIFDQKQGYKNMKRVEPNINYNGEVYEVYIYKEGKFEYCYSNDIDNARYILESLKNK